MSDDAIIGSASVAILILWVGAGVYTQDPAVLLSVAVGAVVGYVLGSLPPVDPS